MNSGLCSEKTTTSYLGYMAYFISINLKLASHAVDKSEGIYVLSVQIYVLYLYLNYIIKMDGSYYKITGGRSQNMEKFGFVITASQTLQCLCAFTFGSLCPADGSGM
jgi:hypothetical protein